MPLSLVTTFGECKPKEHSLGYLPLYIWVDFVAAVPAGRGKEPHADDSYTPFYLSQGVLL